MSDDVNLGFTPSENAHRDAIHIAVIPLVAGETLLRGTLIRHENGTAIATNEDGVGIVDPFLQKPLVERGTRFWCFLLPNTVTGMRHHWAHPKFDELEEAVPPPVSPQTKEENRKWIADFCDRWNIDYDQLIEAATGKTEWRYVSTGGNQVYKDEMGDEYNEFWRRFEEMTNQQYSDDHKDGMYFTCSC